MVPLKLVAPSVTEKVGDAVADAGALMVIDVAPLVPSAGTPAGKLNDVPPAKAATLVAVTADVKF